MIIENSKLEICNMCGGRADFQFSIRGCSEHICQTCLFERLNEVKFGENYKPPKGEERDKS